MWKSVPGANSEALWITTPAPLWITQSAALLSGISSGRLIWFTRPHTKGERFVLFLVEEDRRVGERPGTRRLAREGQATLESAMARTSAES